jgi:hypothetical protein
VPEHFKKIAITGGGNNKVLPKKSHPTPRDLVADSTKSNARVLPRRDFFEEKCLGLCHRSSPRGAHAEWRY